MSSFTPISALIGGAFIGLSASLMLLTTGRVSGISGIFGGLFTPARGTLAWRVAFVAGLLLAGLGLAVLSPPMLANTTGTSAPVLLLAGLLVGVGVRMGSGCTSGHGVCGISRLSARSIAATLTFMGTGMATATLVQLFGGGGE